MNSMEKIKYLKGELRKIERLAITPREGQSEADRLNEIQQIANTAAVAVLDGD